jgi:ubiquinone/menaquinone biosynthesis C-methylase UbiE
MTEWKDSGSAMLRYYDADYPSEGHGRFPENFDETTRYQGLMHDVARYREIVRDRPGPVLELCCGTGRVAIPLANDGHQVTGVDISTELLRQLRANVDRIDATLLSRLTLVEANVTELDLPKRSFRTAIIAFNSLLCIADFDAQRRVLSRVCEHLSDDGVLVLDIVNPLRLAIQGDPVPKPFFTRREPHSGNRYTRFAMVDALDERHVQRLHGWYDETLADGTVRRSAYATTWRPIHRYEIQLMLEEAGLSLVSIEGGHLRERFTAQSPRMFIQAAKRTA